VLPINVVFFLVILQRNCDFKVEHSGLNDATKHSVTESTELNPGCQQPFLFDKMSSAAKTPAIDQN
jgi:hypothetical protein